MPSSLCRLSSGSQFCLSQFNIGKLQTKLLEEEASLCIGTDTPNSCWTLQSPLHKEQDSGAVPVDAKSRNTSFMISLMDICNKMILPLAALHQDCDTYKEDADSTGHPSQTPPRKSCCHLCQPSLSDSETPSKNSMGSQHMAGRQTNQHHQTNSTTWEDPGVENNCCWNSGNNNAELVGKKETRQQWQLRQPQSLQHRKSSRNPPNPISNQQKAIQQQRCGNNHHAYPGKVTQRDRQQQQQPQQQLITQTHCSKTRSQTSHPSTQTAQMNAKLSPELQQPPSGPLDADDESGGCGAEAPSSTTTGSRAQDDRPLLTDHGVMKWNVAEFQDFRPAAMSSNNQVYDPMQYSGTHRHVLILDSQWRLKTAVPGFRVHLYRPY